jgi:hypothetical protein
MDDDPSENQDNPETYTREDIEQSRAEEVDAKLDKLITVSAKARRESSTDDNGITHTDSVLSLTPPEDGYSVLKSYGYSRVEIGRSSALGSDGEPIYPWTTIVETYDDEDISKDQFFLIQTAEKMRIGIGDEDAGTRPLGIHQDTGETTTDIESFDREQASAMLPAKLRRLEGSEYANLVSIITACEVDDR